MNVFKSFALVFVASLWCASDCRRSRKPQICRHSEDCIYRVAGDISGDTSLTDDIFEGLPRPDPLTKSPYTIFTLAKLTVGGVKLEADVDGWKWDGQEEPPPGRRV